MYEKNVRGSLNKSITAKNEPFEDVLQPGYFAAALQLDEPCMVRQLACLLWLAVLSCISLALGGCSGSSVTGTSAQSGPLTASPSLVVFGSVPVGQRASATISVTNSGSAAMQITQVSVTGQTYSVNGVGNLPVTVGAGSTYQFSVEFWPQSTGTQAAQLKIASNAASNAMVIGLDGVGMSNPSLSPGTNAVTFGNVALNAVSTQSITLSNGSLPVSISAATVVGSGFSLTGSSFPVSLDAGQATTLDLQFVPTEAGPATGTLTIVSTSLTNPSMDVSLSGTGIVGGPYSVDLTWDVPTNSQDPVAGYSVYRSPSGASSYELLTSSILTTNTYVDSSIQPGQSYDYVVESVDESGVESAPSNIASIAIP